MRRSPASRLPKVRRAALWLDALRRAPRLRPRGVERSLALLGQILTRDVELPGPTGGAGVRLGSDGTLTIRFTSVPAVAESGVEAAMLGFREELRAVGTTLSALEAAVDATVGLASLGVALAAASTGAGWGSLLRFAVVSVGYAALIPLRRLLLNLLLRGLVRSAMYRIAA